VTHNRRHQRRFAFQVIYSLNFTRAMRKEDLIRSFDNFWSEEEFDMDRVENECRSLNPGVKTFRISARTGEGMADLCAFLRGRWESL